MRNNKWSGTALLIDRRKAIRGGLSSSQRDTANRWYNTLSDGCEPKKPHAKQHVLSLEQPTTPATRSGTLASRAGVPTTATGSYAGLKEYPPSQHYLMPLEHRIALYKRVIGFLRYCELRQESFSVRMKEELKTNIHLASLITGSMIFEAREQLHLMRVLLADVLMKSNIRGRDDD